MRKYYTYGIDSFRKWKLLSLKQIKILQKIHKDYNQFYSIHTYYNNGSKGCPVLYIDLDGPSAKKDMKLLRKEIKEKLGAYPEVWDSGNKGYHVIIPKEVLHNRCEKIAEYIVSKFTDVQSFDPSVYSSKRMWRIPNTHNVKGQRNKSLIYEADITELNEKLLDEWILEAKAHIKQKEEQFKKRLQEKNEGTTAEIVPCVKSLIENMPPKGIRHYSIVQIASFFNQNEVDIESAFASILKQPHWEEHRDHIVEVFESIYNSERGYGFGCRGSKILRDRCMVFCKYYNGE